LAGRPKALFAVWGPAPGRGWRPARRDLGKGGNPLPVSRGEPRSEKVREVEELTELLSQSTLVVLTDYRGLKVTDIRSLRGKLREQGIIYRVAKNTMLELAADRAGKPALKSALTGPTAVAFGNDELSTLARTLGDFERNSRIMKVKAGLLGDRLLPAADVLSLATMPSRNELLGQVVAGMQAPMAGLVGVLSGVIGGLVGTLEARRQQLEEQGSAS
jgi:large subunit ribosomal protein L10